MTPQSDADLLARLSAGCALGSVLLVGLGTWFAGEQVSVLGQWPLVIMATGLGVGLVAFAGVLHVASRRRVGELRLEAALARMLRAAGEFAGPIPPSWHTDDDAVGVSKRINRLSAG